MTKIVDQVLDKIKETRGIEKLDDTVILIDTGDKLPGHIKNVVILITCVIKEKAKFYPQISLEEALYG